MTAICPARWCRYPRCNCGPVTIQRGPHATAQGPLIERHSDGTATVDAGGAMVRGPLIERERR